MISNIPKLVADFKSVLASLTPDQVAVIATLSDAINERLQELREEIANGESNQQESVSQ